MKEIAYAVIDSNVYVQDHGTATEIPKYLKLSLEEKLIVLKERIEKIYSALKNIHGEKKHIFIIMREALIGPATDRPHNSKSILNQAQEKYVLDYMSNLTQDKDLTLIPGTLISYKEDPDSKITLVSNRAYVLQEGQVIAFQGKQKFPHTDLRGANLTHSKPIGDKIGNVIDLKSLGIKLLIDICADSKENYTHEAVDLYLVLSNSCFLKNKKGKLTIHCDGSRPTTYFNKDKMNRTYVYISPLFKSIFELYQTTEEQSDFFIKNEIELSLPDPESFKPPEENNQRPVSYAYEEIYRPENKIKLPSDKAKSLEKNNSFFNIPEELVEKEEEKSNSVGLLRNND